MPGEALASIRGLPEFPSITEVNVRNGPTTSEHLIFRVPVGMSGLSILEVQPDSAGATQHGKIFQWFRLVFHGGAVGWVRDDLLNLQGDARQFGYPDLDQESWAFSLTRGSLTAPRPTPGDFTPAPQDIDRVRKAAFAITSAFEGASYSSFFNQDAAIVSYGILQFSLAAGSLVTIINRYLASSDSDEAKQLRFYQDRIQHRDPLLRTDGAFRAALIAAGSDPKMREAQDSVADEGFWRPVVEGYIQPRSMQTPLGWALLFDMGVHFGTNHGWVRRAERELGLPPRAPVGTNGITEQQLIAHLAELRRRSHADQAARTGFTGLRVRGEFWVNRVAEKDWGLQGDAAGNVNVFGRIVKVRQPD